MWEWLKDRGRAVSNWFGDRGEDIAEVKHNFDTVRDKRNWDLLTQGAEEVDAKIAALSDEDRKIFDEIYAEMDPKIADLPILEHIRPSGIITNGTPLVNGKELIAYRVYEQFGDLFGGNLVQKADSIVATTGKNWLEGIVSGAQQFFQDISKDFDIGQFFQDPKAVFAGLLSNVKTAFGNLGNNIVAAFDNPIGVAASQDINSRIARLQDSLKEDGFTSDMVALIGDIATDVAQKEIDKLEDKHTIPHFIDIDLAKAKEQQDTQGQEEKQASTIAVAAPEQIDNGAIVSPSTTPVLDNMAIAQGQSYESKISNSAQIG